MITPNQIREKTISTVESGGYDKTEVNELLLEVIESYEAVYTENKELYRKMEILANRIEEYRADEDSIKTALITAQKMASQVVNEAKEKAEKTVSESASSAQQTVLDAKEKAEKIISEARDYVASLTQEKEKAAQEIVSGAESKANEAIDSAKIVAQNVLDKAKTLSKELVEKAKEEKTYHEELASRLKTESKGFKESLISLYETQLGRLKDLAEDFDIASDDTSPADAIENEINSLISSIDEITGENVDEAVVEPAQEEIEDQEADEAVAEAIEAEDVDEVEAEEEEFVIQETEASQQEGISEAEEDAEVDSIIEELEASQPDELEDFEEIDEEPQDIGQAIDAFSSDEITPIADSTPSIPVIEDEPEFESEPMPFESYFNVNKSDPHNTDETISLIPPDDDDEDDNTKFKGFFKKKK